MYLEDVGFLAVFIAFTVAIIAVPVIVIRQIDHHFQAKACPVYSVQTGRDTKFVDINYWNYGCYAVTSDNKFLPIDQLRDITD